MPDRAVGIYIHIPFCNGKCPYCDFYSVGMTDELRDNYIIAVEREIAKYPSLHVSTIYFGGGTPTLLGDSGLVRLLKAVRTHFHVAPDAETTFEMNPRTADITMLRRLRRAGFNRVSMGLQSGVDSELEALGRMHTVEDTRRAVQDIRQAGFDNLSLDLMLGIPNQTSESLQRSIDVVCSLEPEHISAYILKVEPDTPFASIADSLNLADDDGQAELYTQAVLELDMRGFHRYEISNFAKAGRESRHNSAYWNCGEYLGFGPGAHSFFDGRRFFYPRDLDQFINAPVTVDDGNGGSSEEYLMLRLRMAEGVTSAGWRKRFGEDIPTKYYQRAKPLVSGGLLETDGSGIRLCGKGFLLSNAVIGRLIDE